MENVGRRPNGNGFANPQYILMLKGTSQNTLIENTPSLHYYKHGMFFCIIHEWRDNQKTIIPVKVWVQSYITSMSITPLHWYMNDICDTQNFSPQNISRLLMINYNSHLLLLLQLVHWLLYTLCSALMPPEYVRIHSLQTPAYGITTPAISLYKSN